MFLNAGAPHITEARGLLQAYVGFHEVSDAVVVSARIQLCIPAGSGLQSGQYSLRRKRRPAQARAGCIEDRIRNRSRDRHN